MNGRAAAATTTTAPVAECSLRCYPADDVEFAAQAMDALRRCEGFGMPLERVAETLQRSLSASYPGARVRRQEQLGGDGWGRVLYCYRDGRYWSDPASKS